MIKTYTDFLAVVNTKCAQYDQIPEDHLSFTGQKVYGLYKAVKFNTCFASDATELLSLLGDDEDVEEATKYVGSEYRKIIRCLEWLAFSENLAPTT